MFARSNMTGFAGISAKGGCRTQDRSPRSKPHLDLERDTFRESPGLSFIVELLRGKKWWMLKSSGARPHRVDKAVVPTR